MTSVVADYEGTAAEWDAFVRRQAGWSHFHLYGWRRVMERVFGHECIYLASRGVDGSIEGVLALVRVRSLVFGHYLVSLPFLNYGGPLGTDEAVRALSARAVELAQRDRVDLLEFRCRNAIPVELPVSHRKLTVVLDLPTDPSVLWSALPSKVRSQIRRPRKEGVEVRHGLDQLDAFYSVFAHHMRDLGTPVQSRRLFQTIADVFPSDVRFAAAYHQGNPVACGCGFLWDGEFEMSWASALRSHKAISPNMLMYWDMMERMAAEGARLFNFGRCSPDSGTYRFKMQWGGRAEPLWWYYRARRSPAAGEPATPSQERGIFAAATRVWQRLPLPLTNRLGPAIVRFIP